MDADQLNNLEPSISMRVDFFSDNDEPGCAYWRVETKLFGEDLEVSRAETMDSAMLKAVIEIAVAECSQIQGTHKSRLIVRWVDSIFRAGSQMLQKYLDT